MRKKNITRVMMALVSALVLTTAGLAATSCDKSETSEEHRKAEADVIGIQWKLDEMYLTNATTGERAWRPASDARLEFYFRLGNDGKYRAYVNLYGEGGSREYQGEYTQVGSTFRAMDGTRELFVFQLKSSTGAKLEGTLMLTDYASRNYEVRMKQG